MSGGARFGHQFSYGLIDLPPIVVVPPSEESLLPSTALFIGGFLVTIGGVYVIMR